MTTIGRATSLSIDDKVGNFMPGKEVDFVVLDWAATDLQQLRFSYSSGIEDKLFALIMLGDDRNIFETLVVGKSVYQRDTLNPR
ncbi:amidohydrolase family protein [Shewanella algicola]|uniref:amidohydrolase family protein n=1 Tax=Shewanella algicola TaxID=640633 RepID=UPI002494D051|nr:amidohydrolase family protein [Shewanella algicola]